MKLKILSFWGNSFESQEVESFTLKTKSWEITVLDKHESLITTLVPGVIKIVFNNGEEPRYFAVWKGILEIADSQAKVLTDMLVNPEEVEENELEKAMKKAEELREKYKNTSSKEDMQKFLEASEQLSKVQAKVKLVELQK